MSYDPHDRVWTVASGSLRWFRSIASEFVAAIDPITLSDGSLSLAWSRFGNEYTATFGPDGSLFMLAEQLAGEWDEWAQTIEEVGPKDEARIRNFYAWSVPDDAGGSNP